MAGRDPFPGSALTEGTWGSIKTGHELIYLGGRVLDWEPASGRYHLWHYDRNLLQAGADPLPGSALTEGEWGSIKTGHQLVFLGGDRVLDWVPETGDFKVWRYDANVGSGSDPFPGSALAEGNWRGIRHGHTLIYMYNNRVLDWEAGSGQYKIWSFDRNATGDPFPGSPITEGSWGSVNTGHELVYLEQERLLDWEPATGRYRVWRYDGNVMSGNDPLPGSALTDGNWGGIKTGHRLISLGVDEVLDWVPETGGYRVWRYDRSI